MIYHQRANNLNPLYTLANVTRLYTTQFNVYSQFSSHPTSTQQKPTQDKSITYNTKLTSLVTFQWHYIFHTFIWIHYRLSRLYMQPPNNNFCILFTFYRLNFIIQQWSHEHLNQLLLLSCNFNKFGNFNKVQG